jgi:hypothetical protein
VGVLGVSVSVYVVGVNVGVFDGKKVGVFVAVGVADGVPVTVWVTVGV